MGTRSDHAYCNRYLRNRPPVLALGPSLSDCKSGAFRPAPLMSPASDFKFALKLPPDRLVPLGPTSFSAALFCFATSAYLAAKGVLRNI